MHLNGFSPVWVLICLVSDHLDVNSFKHAGKGQCWISPSPSPSPSPSTSTSSSNELKTNGLENSCRTNIKQNILLNVCRRFKSRQKLAELIRRRCVGWWIHLNYCNLLRFRISDEDERIFREDSTYYTCLRSTLEMALDMSESEMKLLWPSPPSPSVQSLEDISLIRSPETTSTSVFTGAAVTRTRSGMLSAIW